MVRLHALLVGWMDDTRRKGWMRTSPMRTSPTTDCITTAPAIAASTSHHVLEGIGRINIWRFI